MPRSAARKTLPGGWLSLPEGELTISSASILVPDELDEDEDEIERLIRRLGFPVGGLETQTLEAVGDE